LTLTNATQKDAALVAAAREDAAAFDVLYRRYATRVYRYCYARTNSGQVAEDLTAQTFLAALEGIGRFRGDGSVAAWLFGIAANVCKGYYRYQRRHPQAPLETVSERTDVNAPDPERHSLSPEHPRLRAARPARAQRRAPRSPAAAFFGRPGHGGNGSRDGQAARRRTQAPVTGRRRLAQEVSR
jgi:RNA polymerase sigma factor (sigma-70 family)